MSFVWFWTFWHWCGESFREGRVLRGPLHGIAGHWDEWFSHEASDSERRAIAKVGTTEAGQRAFIDWLCDVWTKEIDRSANRSVSRFVLAQLAPLPPFSRWETMAAHRAGYDAAGIAAIVVAEQSAGERADIRRVDALLLPSDPEARALGVVAEDFRAEKPDLELPRQAAISLFGGRGLLALLSLWSVAGRRPYPRAAQIGLAAGWLAAAGLIGRLLFGPEPGDALVPLCAGLALLVTTLGGVGLVGLSWQCLRAWRCGKAMRRALSTGQVRIRMSGELTVRGGSAGLAFCLNMMLATHRALPESAARAWIWRAFFQRFGADRESWAATGALTPQGWVRPVVLAPKVRACLQHAAVGNLLVPQQRASRRRSIEGFAAAASPTVTEGSALPPEFARPQLGFASELCRLRVWRCLHVAQGVFALGRLGSAWQTAVSAVAVAVLATTISGWGDLRAILVPPPAPFVVAPGSPSPYYLWVSIDASSPRHFRAVFESSFWSNRRADFEVYGGANGSVRAEIPLRRLSRLTYGSEEDGVVWIERRRRFLGREYTPGERVGRYSFSYVSRLKP